MSEFLRVKEIYKSIQGESTWAGLPCIFVRLTGCTLRCSYCDSVYAFTGGEKIQLNEILNRVDELSAGHSGYIKSTTGEHRLPLVELTGGEPLIQPASLPLMDSLVQNGYEVLLETSGAFPIEDIHSKVHIIMDLKCPSSGESEKNLRSNLDHISSKDEIKFVCGTREDLDFVEMMIRDYQLEQKTNILVSWVAPLTQSQQYSGLKRIPEGHVSISRLDLVEEIIARKLPVRFQLQMHKFIWPVDKVGV